MKGMAFNFLLLAGICALVGMGWGIQMSASGDHAMAPAHAHLNLLGWVGFAVFAFYYHLVPAAAQTWLARAHFALAVLGIVVLVPGIYLAIANETEVLAKIGSVIAVLSMLVFLAVIWTSRQRG